MMIIRKRQILLSALVLALGAAVFINWYYTKPDKIPSENDKVSSEQAADGNVNLGDAKYVLSTDVTVEDTTLTEDEFFSQAKRKRREAHDEAAEVLNDIVKDTASSPDSVENASQKLEELADAISAESDMENLINAKLGCKCLAIINDDKTEIIVEKGALNSASAVQIKEIAVRFGAVDSDKITISELKY